MLKRIIYNFVLLCAIFYTPWWVVAPLAFAGAFIFPDYFEILFAGLLIDLSYGSSASALHGVAGVTSAVLLFVLARIAKSFVRQAY